MHRNGSSMMNGIARNADGLRDRRSRSDRAMRAVGIFVIAAMLCIPAMNAGAAQSGGPADHNVRHHPPEARMEHFLRVLRRADADSLLPFFPRHGDWTYRQTMHRKAGDRVGLWRLRPEDTREAIKGPLADSFEQPNHAIEIARLMHQVRHRPGRWLRVGQSRFVPPGGDASSDIFIEWRMEDGEWVISTVADEVYGKGSRCPRGAASVRPGMLTGYRSFHPQFSVG